MQGALGTDPDLRADLDLLIEVTQAAGALALGYFQMGERTRARVDYKLGGSPVTEADLAADALLKQRCLDARPDYGWLSEETADSPERLGKKRCFVVDPIDGTRAFVGGMAEWCVCAAIVENGRPIVGVIHAPVLGEVFHASLNGGAFLNGQSLSTPAGAPLSDALVEGPKPLVDDIARRTGFAFRRRPRVYSLAYRILMAAKGSVDLGLATADSHDWDIAAADLIICEAGGILIEEGVATPLYNTAGLRHGRLIAGPRRLAEELAAQLQTG